MERAVNSDEVNMEYIDSIGSLSAPVNVHAQCNKIIILSHFSNTVCEIGRIYRALFDRGNIIFG